MKLAIKCRQIECIVLLVVALTVGRYTIVVAESAPPQPPIGPHLNPPEGPNATVANNHQIYNDLLVPNLPTPARNADIEDDGQKQEVPGRGVRQIDTGLSSGQNLYTELNTCLDFNQFKQWSAQSMLPGDHYAGWGVYAVNDGWLYRSENVVVTLERVVGPGSKYGVDQYAIKFAGNQPYAVGLGSPIIAAPPDSIVSVSIKYMIFDHDTQGQDYDWVSLGLKPNAEDTGPESATFVNGYRRGVWTELVHSLVVGTSGKIMILIQAQSPAALNSNIYFDDVQVAVNGQYLSSCIFE